MGTSRNVRSARAPAPVRRPAAAIRSDPGTPDVHAGQRRTKRSSRTRPSGPWAFTCRNARPDGGRRSALERPASGAEAKRILNVALDPTDPPPHDLQCSPCRCPGSVGCSPCSPPRWWWTPPPTPRSPRCCRTTCRPTTWAESVRDSSRPRTRSAPSGSLCRRRGSSPGSGRSASRCWPWGCSGSPRSASRWRARAALLAAARLAQGVGAAGLWAAALAWAIAVAPPGRRSEVIGTVTGAAIVGAVGGPVLGVLGDLVGVRAVFGAFVLVPTVLGVLVARRPAPPAVRREGGLRGARPRLRRPRGPRRGVADGGAVGRLRGARAARAAAAGCAGLVGCCDRCGVPGGSRHGGRGVTGRRAARRPARRR